MTSSPWTRSAALRWSPTSWWCSAPTSAPSPSSTLVPSTLEPWPVKSASRSCSGWIPPSTRPSPSGRRTTCARSTHRSRSCCAARSTTLDAASRPPPCAVGVGRVRTVGSLAARTAPPSPPTLSTRPRTASRRGGPLQPGLDGPARSAPYSGRAGPVICGRNCAQQTWGCPHLQQRSLHPEQAADRTAESCGSLSHVPVRLRPLLQNWTRKPPLPSRLPPTVGHPEVARVRPQQESGPRTRRVSPSEAAGRAEQLPPSG